jgi:hypothetical protein
MRPPAEGNPLESFTRRARDIYNKHPRLSLVVVGIWLANTLVCLVLAGVWLLGDWPGAELALTPTAPVLADQAPTEAVQQGLPATGLVRMTGLWDRPTPE